MSAATATPDIEAVRRWCDRAGMRPDSPLRLALLSTMEAAVAAHNAAAGARGLTPDGERALIQRVAEATALGAEREMLRLSYRLDTRMTVGLAATALLLLVTGYGFGRWQDSKYQDVIDNASFLVQLAELNEMDRLRFYCYRTTFKQDGRRACMLPAIWLEAKKP